MGETDDDTECFSMTEESAGEVKLPEKVKALKKPIVKRAAVRKPRQKKVNDAAAEALKNLLCQWSQEEDCIKKILQGKKLAFVPVFM